MLVVEALNVNVERFNEAWVIGGSNSGDKAFTSYAHGLGTRLPGLEALSGADETLRVFAKDAGAGNGTLGSCLFWRIADLLLASASI